MTYTDKKQEGIDFMVMTVIGFLLVVAVLGVIGGVIVWRAKKKGEAVDPREGVTENVADLNDRFNRARYQDKDGE